jgi:hypothetical protein
MLYELWDDGLYAPACGDEHWLHCCHRKQEPGAKVVWSYEARSSNDAMRALHEHQGWAPYEPMVNPETGRPYPEDDKPFSE